MPAPAPGIEFQVGRVKPQDRPSFPITAALKDGSFIVVQQLLDGEGELTSTIEIAHYDNSGTFLRHIYPNNPNAPVFYLRDAIALDNGGFAVSWMHVHEGQLRGQIQAFTANGAPSGLAPVFIELNRKQTEYYVKMSAVPGGRLAVTWSSVSDIHMRIFEDTATGLAPLGDSFVISKDGFFWSSYMRPNTFTLSDGRIGAVYDAKHQQTNQRDCFYALYAANGTELLRQRVLNSMLESDNQEQAVSAGLTSGGFASVWQTARHSYTWDLVGQIYDQNGNKVGPEFDVSSVYDHHEWHAAIKGLSDGGFVVCYPIVDFKTDYSHLYLQRFNSNGQKVGNRLKLNNLPQRQQFMPPSITIINRNGEENVLTVWWQVSEKPGLRAIFTPISSLNKRQLNDEQLLSVRENIDTTQTWHTPEQLDQRSGDQDPMASPPENTDTTETNPEQTGSWILPGVGASELDIHGRPIATNVAPVRSWAETVDTAINTVNEQAVFGLYVSHYARKAWHWLTGQSSYLPAKERIAARSAFSSEMTQLKNDLRRAHRSKMITRHQFDGLAQLCQEIEHDFRTTLKENKGELTAEDVNYFMATVHSAVRQPLAQEIALTQQLESEASTKESATTPPQPQNELAQLSAYAEAAHQHARLAPPAVPAPLRVKP